MMPSGSATRLLLLLPVASCALRGAVPAVLRSVGAPAATMMRGQARMAAALAEPLSEAPAEVSFNNSWYAVGFAHELSSEEPFATRLWGEPVVLYRDADGEPVCVRDVCPHRSAPLSMGEMQDGVLRCFYHGWGFGAKGACVNVPTGSATAGVCATGYAVAEHDGLLWVWRGHVLSADARRLPAAAATADASFVVETVLDYGCEWSALVARSLAAPHLCSLASPHLAPAGRGQSDSAARDPMSPVVVRHAGVSGGALGSVEEVAHVVPIAPQRARVLLRQRFTAPPLVAFLLRVPGAAALLTFLVRNWNYQLALEDAQQQQGSSTSTAVLDGAAAARVASFRDWNDATVERDGSPYFARWARTNGAQFGQQQVDEAFGTYGLKKNYVLDTPLARYAPLQTSEYAGFLDRYKATQQSVVAALLTAPAGLLTAKTVGPAVAAAGVVLGGHAP